MRSHKVLSVALTSALLVGACAGSTVGEPTRAGANPPTTAAADGTPTTEAPSTFDGQQSDAVSVQGDPLPGTDQPGIIDDAAVDPALGSTAPTLSGTNFNGQAVTIAPDGRAKVVYFLAHWCPHCRAEVELIEQLVADGELPPEVDLYAVSIAVRSDADNFPPSEWLDNFPGTVMRDSAENEGAVASGVSGIPYALYLDGDHVLLSRSVGSLERQQVLSQWRALANG